MSTIKLARIESTRIVLELFAQPSTQAISELLRLKFRG